MTSQFLFCHTLRRQVASQGRLEAILPCAVDEAVEILALFLENKALALPAHGTFPRRIWDTPFFAARLTPRQIATGLFTPEFLALSSNRLLRQLQGWVYHWQLIHPRLKMETAVPETVFEIFHSPEKQSIDDPPPGADDLILAHLHLWGRKGETTYLRLFLGWQEAASLAQCQALIALFQDYVTRVERLRGTARIMNTPPLEESKMEEKPSPSVASSLEETSGQSKLTMTARHADKTEYAALELAQSDLPRPRFYPKSLHKICKMAVARQRWIEQGVIIQDIEWTRQNCDGPSKNTLLKVTDLVLHWDERSYRWDVVRWLHRASGHTPDEITDLVNDLRGKIDPESWALIAHSAQSS